MPSHENQPETGGNVVRTHLEKLGDASGCTEAWIHLSKYRQEKLNQETG